MTKIKADKLQDFYDKVKYRILNKDTSRPYFNTNRQTFDNWHLLTPEQVQKHKIGICYDTANHTAAVLQKQGIPYQVIWAQSRRSHKQPQKYGDDPTHTFVVAKDKDKWRWIQGAWQPFKRSGIEGPNKRRLIKAIVKLLQKQSGLTQHVGTIQKYPQPGITMNDFFDYMTTNVKRKY